MNRPFIIIFSLLGLILFVVTTQLQAQEITYNHANVPAIQPPTEYPVPPPFGLPFATSPSPSTWSLGQGYGNTVGAYFLRNVFYSAGQGLHFGLDFSTPCGTEIVSIGDGIVSEIDSSHGSPPHNLMIDHPNGYSSFYGHLLERTTFVEVGEHVKKGQVVALSGDSFETCRSAPHLHLELRNNFHVRAYNPVPLIDADWDSLALIGSFSQGYSRDLDNPRQWQTMYDQPDVAFGGVMLNDYDNPWPPNR
ncbi:M23 family metallopeptidase [Anaerolineales bacterium HSG6]|nr:M23 family metallopeptidase [Anaerolineales bacterium HSG6]MDM8532460.1 M23 family metallopeptidase [Anaerolineales bacterium HSG25]